MSPKKIQILWDASYMWGIMAWKAMRSFGLPCGLVRAKEIAQGALISKQCALLIVPGGSARQKARLLGEKGAAAIRGWLEGQGLYLGFCGGAGLALADDLLALCPWKRHTAKDRTSSLMSGNVLAKFGKKKICLPVWWPARFEACPHPKIDILATYAAPGPDFILGNNYPPASADEDFPREEPVIIRSTYGQGAYILSYAHLETPASPAANLLLATLLRQFFEQVPSNPTVPQWNTLALIPEDPFAKGLTQLIGYALEQGLIYRRTPWLLGWQAGVPGIALNHLLAMLAALQEQGAEAWLADKEMLRIASDFIAQAGCFFRDLTKNRHLVHNEDFLRKRDRIFGHPMHGKGLADAILSRIEQTLFKAIDQSA